MAVVSATAKLLQEVRVGFRHRHSRAESRQNRILPLNRLFEFGGIQQVSVLYGDPVLYALSRSGERTNAVTE